MNSVCECCSFTSTAIIWFSEYALTVAFIFWYLYLGCHIPDSHGQCFPYFLPTSLSNTPTILMRISGTESQLRIVKNILTELSSILFNYTVTSNGWLSVHNLFSALLLFEFISYFEPV